MMTAPAQQKAKVKAFVARWKAAEGNEDREARSFWIEFMQELLGISNATYALDFERRVKGRKIDVFYEDMGVLVENKSRGCSLDEYYVRSKKAGPETPYQQAKWYADNLPHSIRPRWLIVCNFDEIRIHDLDEEHPGSNYVSVALDELSDNLYLFGFFTDKKNSRIEKEKNLSVKAGELVGKLYDALSKQYQNIDTDENEQHSLNVLCVRQVFLLYAEDAGLLAFKNQFYDYLKAVPVNRMRNALIELFDVLDTPVDERDFYIEDSLKKFPYINGGLFSRDERIVIPQLTDQIRIGLLAEASAGFNWSDISPTIFGAAFESTLNPETRRSGGMHYTSIENIHKVIDPLFLDDLKAELAKIEGVEVERTRIQRLRMFQRKLASLIFFDPAAGSHNFLTETYISLRRLELRVIEDIQGDQTSFALVDSPIMVSIRQFYSIEINDFAVSVGKTALWIAEQQMLEKTQELLPYQEFDFLPLKSITNSVCANALRVDWNELLPAEKCSYIIGNPPFLGYSNQSQAQKSDMLEVWLDSSGAPIKQAGKIDYVSAWYYRAAQYIQGTSIRCAFVSTNSICQGEQVAPIWETLSNQFGISIDFAWTTFVWNSEASDQAHVHVVIVGFSQCGTPTKTIYSKDGAAARAANINAYLSDAPSIYVKSAKTPICNIPQMTTGNRPADGGNLIVENEDYDAFIAAEPSAEKYVRPFMGSREFINNRKRWCLWLVDASSEDIANLPEVSRRVELCRQDRLHAPDVGRRNLAKTPELFREQKSGVHDYLVVPKVSSERRKYIPIGYVDKTTICSDLLFIVLDGQVYEFGILTSLFHNAWMRTVAGRLKSDYRYSRNLVYNTFPWPNPNPDQRALIESCARVVLDVRGLHSNKSLADLYDPDKMPSNLLAAHKALDVAVEAAYGVDFNGDEEKIVAHLFKLYAEMTSDE